MSDAGQLWHDGTYTILPLPESLRPWGSLVLGSSDVITPDDLPESLLEASSGTDVGRAFHARVAALKRDIIREALQRNGDVVAAAARELDLQVTYLHRLIRTLDVRARTTGHEH